MRIRGFVAAGLLAGLAACSTAGTDGPQRTAVPVPRYPVAGLEGVLGQSAAAITRLFGEPNKDIREVGARKLQFTGPFCVLDAYLYAPGSGKEPVVSYLDARQPDGTDIDRASCVAAMQRRDGGRLN